MKARNDHNMKMQNLQVKLDERIAEAKAEQLRIDEQYNAKKAELNSDLQDEINATMPPVEIPEVDGTQQGGVRSRGLLRGLTGAFNTAAAMRVAMSASLPPVIAVDERNANANERSAEILQKIDRKLAGVGLAE